MANDINRMFMIARLTKDPELKTTQGGTSIASISVANNRTYTANGEKKEDVSFFNCIAWGKGGEVMAQYCKKGQRIGIEGRLQQRSWQDKDGGKRSTVEIVIENFQFLSGNGQSATPADGGTQIMGDEVPAGSMESFDQQAPSLFSDSDIPF